MEPKPCPRCGSKPSIVKLMLGWEVTCDNCCDADYTPGGGWERLGVWVGSSSRDDAVAAWNEEADGA
jgi:hypothetical protein